MNECDTRGEWIRREHEGYLEKGRGLIFIQLVLVNATQSLGFLATSQCRNDDWASLKLNFSQYPSIHTNYSISHCTTL